MDRKLYVERWLLAVKDACAAVGLPAHVLALDHKGGKRLSLVIRQGDDAAEFCCRKRLTGVRLLAAATTPAFAARVREVYTRLLQQHRRLLENGYRRFLQRSIRLLREIEAGFQGQPIAPPQIAAAVRQAAKEARPGVLARRLRGLPPRYETLPAACFLTATSAYFVAVVDGKLVELIDLIPGEEHRATPPAVSGAVGDKPSVEPSGVVELVSVAAPAVAVAGTVAAGMPPLLEDPTQAAGAATVPPPAPPQAAGALDGAAALVEGLGNVVDLGGMAVEGVANAGTCLSDAACSAPDCSGFDLSGIDCSGIDCGGIDCGGF